MQVLTKGANAPVPPATALRVAVGWATTGGEVDVDASAILLGPGGRARSDADLVFYGQPRSPEGSVVHEGDARTTADGVQESLWIDLATIPAEVERVAVAVSIHEGVERGLRFSALTGVALVVTDAAGTPVARFDVGPADATGQEVAMVLGELYRRDGLWKVRAVAQGWAEGLAGLARDLGITVEGQPPPAPPSPVPPAAPAKKDPSEMDVEEHVEAAYAVLEAGGLEGHVAEIALGIDLSPSMRDFVAEATCTRSSSSSWRSPCCSTATASSTSSSAARTASSAGAT